MRGFHQRVGRAPCEQAGGSAWYMGVLGYNCAGWEVVKLPNGGGAGEAEGWLALLVRS